MTLAAVLFVAVFGLLLASFPARNGDLWKYLAEGREMARGGAGGWSSSWLYGLASYGVFLAAGGAGLVAAKAAAVAGLAVVLLRASRSTGGWQIPVVCTVLAVLAASTRFLPQPATISYLFLALTIWLLHRVGEAGSRRDGVWPGWPMVLLFAVWANVAPHFVLGLGMVALTWLGRALDGQVEGGRGRYLLRRAGALAVLAAAAAVSPAHVNGFRVPPELGWSAESRTAQYGPQPITSPFSRAYVSAFQNSPAALAYYPLLGLGLLSFAMALPRWRWERFLPWLGLAVVSGLNARAVPFFAVVAGPVLAWNLGDYCARRPRRGTGGTGVQWAARGLTAVLAAALLVSAWPGWLQGPPYGPRQWVVETPTALERAAAAVGRWHKEGVWPPGTRTLHLSPDTAHAFAWFCPDDDGLLDDQLAVETVGATDPDEQSSDRLRAAGVTRVVVQVADRGPGLEVLEQLLADPQGWPMLHTSGGAAVFGRRDPARTGNGDPFRGREVDFDRLAFRPTEDEKVPPPPRREAARRWWHAFWRATPQRSPDRDEATLLVLKAEAERRSAPVRHLQAWVAGQAITLVAAGGGRFGPAVPADLALQITLLQPPPPDPADSARVIPPITRTAFSLQRQAGFVRGDVPPGVLYAAVRAARRAVAADPTDASAYFTLGQVYLRLLGSTTERGWAGRLPQMARLRQLQASAALNRAVALNPAFAQAHLELAMLYRELGCGDLAITHLRLYRNLAARSGRELDPRGSAEELERLSELLERYSREFATESGRAPVGDRAAMAARRGLGGEALRLLLESDISAFGTPGMELELDLLLRTGRPGDVLEWTTPEMRESLGVSSYHWLRAQAHLAEGDYTAADEELSEMTGPPARPARVGAMAGRLTAQALLGERAGGLYLPDLVWRTFARNDFLSGVVAMGQTLTQQSESATIRGLAALEAGEIGRAREAFRTALAFAPDRSADFGYGFSGWPIARACLSWIETAGPERPEAFSVTTP